MLTSLSRWYCYHVRFTDEGSEAEQLGKVAKVTKW